MVAWLHGRHGRHGRHQKKVKPFKRNSCTACTPKKNSDKASNSKKILGGKISPPPSQDI
jgi:hypothetical protein